MFRSVAVLLNSFNCGLNYIKNDIYCVQNFETFLINNRASYIIEEYNENGKLSNRSRRELGNVTVRIMIETFGKNIPIYTKLQFAKRIVEFFPRVKDPVSTRGGYVCVQCIFFEIQICKI